jgi:hypothetical protein
MPATTLDQARAAKEALRARLAGQTAVVGIGITRVGEDYAVKVNLETATVTVPERVDGVRVVTEVVGSIRKQ